MGTVKPLVIYHAHCTDGFGAAFCAWLKFGDEAEYVAMNYGFQEKDMPDYQDREVYMLDFSWPKPWMDNLITNAKRLIWLDHHKTAFEMWCETEREKHVCLYPLPNDHVIVLDNSKSGAMLAWEHFNPEREAPEFIKWIDDRDRWQFKYTESKPFHAAMSMLRPWNFEQWLAELDNSARIVEEGELLLRYADQQIKSLAKYARPCSIDITVCGGPPMEHPGLAVNTSMHMSEVGHELANASGSFGLIWYLGEGDTAKVSLRSNGDYDVSIIAKQFGGGGHRNAAGFSVPITTLLSWLK